MRRHLAAFAFIFSALTLSPLASCASTPIEAQSGREYAARGVVRAIDPSSLSITIAHENVEGYMPAMTMPFTLTSASQVQGLSVGDAIDFRFRAESGGRHVIVSIRRR